MLLAGLVLLGPGLAGVPTAAQTPVAGEVRQLVTFSFLPGAAGDAMEAYREQAIPLYRRNEAMLSFRGFREVESPIALDLIVVSSFVGMSGMDASNEALRGLATEAGTSIGAIYGGLAAMSTGHTDQFVEMLPTLGRGDPSATRLTALVWIRVPPGESRAFEDALGALLASDDPQAPPSATGRFLVSDGWDYLQFVGFESLGDFQEYRTSLDRSPAGRRLAGLTAERRDVIVANVPVLSVR